MAVVKVGGEAIGEARDFTAGVVEEAEAGVEEAETGNLLPTLDLLPRLLITLRMYLSHLQLLLIDLFEKHFQGSSPSNVVILG